MHDGRGGGRRGRCTLEGMAARCVSGVPQILETERQGQYGIQLQASKVLSLIHSTREVEMRMLKMGRQGEELGFSRGTELIESISIKGEFIQLAYMAWLG